MLVLVCSCNGQPNSDKKSADKSTKTEKKATPTHLTKAEFLAKVVNYEANPTEWKYLGDKPCLIDFYTTWCGPCKMLAPHLEELAAEYDDKIYIYKVDTEKEPELAAAFGIRSIPTLLFVPMTKQPQMSQGYLDKETLKNVIETVILAK